MPVDLPPTPNFSDDLEQRLRGQVGRRSVGSRVAPVLAVAAALAVGAGAVVALGEGDDPMGEAAAPQPPAKTAAVVAAPGPAAEAPTILFAELRASGGGAIGGASVEADGTVHRLTVKADGLSRERGYGIWLDGDRYIGRLTAIEPDGHVLAQAQLPADLTTPSSIRITRETEDDPRRPGETVLAGDFDEPERRKAPESGTTEKARKPTVEQQRHTKLKAEPAFPGRRHKQACALIDVRDPQASGRKLEADRWTVVWQLLDEEGKPAEKVAEPPAGTVITNVDPSDDGRKVVALELSGPAVAERIGHPQGTGC